MERFLIVCGAGAAGCGVRYLVSLWTLQRFGAGFPWGTLFVNLLGSFAIALVLELSTRVAGFSPNLRLALTTGFLGGLTTYSSFNFESTKLLFEGHALRGVAYLAATMIGCLALGVLGIWVGRRLG